MGIEPTSSAWKAEVIATIRHPQDILQRSKMEREGFEPSKAKPADLQSALVDRLSISPKTYFNKNNTLFFQLCQIFLKIEKV